MRRRWTKTEECVLIENYAIKTIKELLVLFPGRNEESLNCKIKRLKKEGRLTTNKKKETIFRSYVQRTIKKKN